MKVVYTKLTSINHLLACGLLMVLILTIRQMARSPANNLLPYNQTKTYSRSTSSPLVTSSIGTYFHFLCTFPSLHGISLCQLACF